MTWPLSDDTNAIVLLCAWFGGEREHKPLTFQEYNELATWLKQHGYHPRDLIRYSSTTEEASKGTGLSYDRLTALLDRGITLGFYLEAWERRGFWIMSREDIAYPKRIRQNLGSQAPPVLFGTGEITILDQGGVAVMGSDQVAFRSSERARIVTRLCTQHHHTIITAGKQAISNAAVEGVGNSGGTLIWLLQGSTLAKPLGKTLRDAKRAGNVALLSIRSPADRRSIPREPEVGHLLMALCNSAVYVDSTEFSMDRYCLEEAISGSLRQRKCFVWQSEQTTSLGERLIQAGAQPWVNVQFAIEEGLFEVDPEISQNASLQPENIKNIEEGRASNIERDKSGIKEKADVSSYGVIRGYGVQSELFEAGPRKLQVEGMWELTRSHQAYPKAIRANMGSVAPPLLHGVGTWNLLRLGGLAIIGPDSIPSTRIKKACQAAAIASKRGQIVITAGHLKMAKEIVQTVYEHSGYVIWVLFDGTMKQYLNEPWRQAIRKGCLVMIKARGSGNKSIVGSLAVGFADNILYVDGSNFKDSNKRKDQFGTRAAIEKRSSKGLSGCKLLHGRTLSPEGQKLKELGFKAWTDKELDLNVGSDHGQRVLQVETDRRQIPQLLW